MNISKLKEADIKEFSKLVKEVIEPTTCYHKEAKKEIFKGFTQKELKNKLAYKNSLLLTIKEKNEIVAFMEGYFLEGGIFSIEWIGVKRNFRGMGASKKMLEYTIKQAKKRGMHKISCVIRPTNKPSIAFFTKNDFKKQTLFKNHWYKLDFAYYYRYI